MSFYTKGDVRIHYEEVGSGFPLLVTPGGGLNSLISSWPNQVFSAMEEFKNDFRSERISFLRGSIYNFGEWCRRRLRVDRYS